MLVLRQLVATAITVTAFVAGRSAWAQGRPGEPPRWSGYSFVLGRHVAGRSTTLVGGYRAGAAIVVAGGIAEDRARRWTVLVGVGTHLSLGTGAGITLIPTVTAANQGTTLTLYAFPRLQAGAVHLDASISLRQPLGGTIRRGLAVNPAVVTFPAGSRVRFGAGASMTLAARTGAVWHVGPALVLRLPAGALTGAALARAGRIDTRVSYSARF